jgi:hypothetical protein
MPIFMAYDGVEARVDLSTKPPRAPSVSEIVVTKSTDAPLPPKLQTAPLLDNAYADLNGSQNIIAILIGL